MVGSGPWSLRSGAAKYESPSLSSEIDLADVSRGVRVRRLHGRPCDDLECLALGLGVELDTNALRRTEQYVRSNSLAAEYEVASDPPFRLALRWEGCEQLPGGGIGMDLTASVNAVRLDSHPEICVRTEIRGPCTLSYLTSVTSDEWQPVSPVEGRWIELVSEDQDARPSCVLISPTRHSPLTSPDDASYAQSLFYAEMAAPPDVVATSFCMADDRLQLRHSLFDLSLEKGVILKTRIRAVFYPPEAVRESVTATFRQLLSGPPPLVT